MKITEAKKGMIVRVSTDLTKSNDHCGAASEMYDMQDTICIIQETDASYVYIKSEKYGVWWFHPHDITAVATDEEMEKREKEKAKQLLFDPENIVR